MIDEASRHRLFNKLDDVLGAEDAAVLIEHLSPVGWRDVATKRDLEQSSNRLSGQMDLHGAGIANLRADIRELRSEFVSLRSDIGYQFRTTVFAMMGMMVTLTGLIFAAVRLG